MSDDHAKQPQADEQRVNHTEDHDTMHENREGELLGDLLDEIAAPDEIAAANENMASEPAIAPIDEDAIDIESRDFEDNESPEEEQKSSMLLIGIIAAIVVGGITYFATKSDAPEKAAVTTTQQTATPVPAVQQKAATVASAKASDAVKEALKKPVQAAVASSEEEAATENPVSLKPLLEPAAEAAPSTATTASPAKQTAFASAVAVHLELDPITRKVISPMDGKTTFVWAVNLMSLSTHAAADRVITKLKANGTETELVQLDIGEKIFYRIRVGNFASVEEADAAHAIFKEDPLYANSWVSRYRK